MRRFALRWPLLVAFVLATSTLLPGQSRNFDERLIILSSSDAPGSITPQRLASCLQQLVHEWSLDERALPQIMLVHASKKVALKVRVTDAIAIRKNGVHGNATEYFEIWVVGEPQLRAIVIALENVLEAHYQLHFTDAQRNTVIARVVRMQDATIDIAEGK